MSPKHSKDRASRCAFTFSDGRRCQTPRLTKEDYCFFHARKLRLAAQADDIGRQVTSPIGCDYNSALTLNATLGNLMCALARGQITPKTAHTLAYLAQIMMQTIPAAQQEFARAFGPSRLTGTLVSCFRSVNPSFVEAICGKREAEDDHEEDESLQDADHSRTTTSTDIGDEAISPVSNAPRTNHSAQRQTLNDLKSALTKLIENKSS